MKTENGLLSRVYGGCGIILFVAVVTVSPLAGESLWEPGFSGYITPGSSVEVGDQLLVEIRPNTELKLASSHIDSENARLNFSGGEGKGLFDFLPEAQSSSEREVEEEDSYALSTRMAVEVVAVSESGNLSLRGERSIEINALKERIVLSGSLSPSALRSDGETEGAVPFDLLHNAELSYSGIGYGADTPVQMEDLVRPEEAPASEPATEAEAAGAGAGGETAEAEGEANRAAETGNTGEGAYTISEERRRELLLQYMNRFVDLLFAR